MLGHGQVIAGYPPPLFQAELLGHVHWQAIKAVLEYRVYRAGRGGGREGQGAMHAPDEHSAIAFLPPAHEAQPMRLVRPMHTCTARVNCVPEHISA